MHLAFLTCPPLRSDIAIPARRAGGITWLACLASLCFPANCLAAGGHHAVDDAGILEPGHGQVETWLERSGRHQLQHLGSGCHALGLELGISLERSVQHGEPAVRSMGLQLKWARELQPGLSIGGIWSGIWQSGSPRFTGHSVVLPLSWSVREDLTLHLNAGRDMPAQGAGHALHGLALEWHVTPGLEALAEWWRDGLGPKRRFALRYVVNEHLSLDLSRARSAQLDQGHWWALGVNWAFSR